MIYDILQVVWNTMVAFAGVILIAGGCYHLLMKFVADLWSSNINYNRRLLRNRRVCVEEGNRLLKAKEEQKERMERLQGFNMLRNSKSLVKHPCCKPLKDDSCQKGDDSQLKNGRQDGHG